MWPITFQLYLLQFLNAVFLFKFLLISKSVSVFSDSNTMILSQEKIHPNKDFKAMSSRNQTKKMDFKKEGRN